MNNSGLFSCDQRHVHPPVFLQKCTHPPREGSPAATSQARRAASAPATAPPGLWRTVGPRGRSARLKAQQPSHRGDRAAPKASRSPCLGPSAPSGVKLRGPQQEWPGTSLGLETHILHCSLGVTQQSSELLLQRRGTWGPAGLQGREDMQRDLPLGAWALSAPPALAPREVEQASSTGLHPPRRALPPRGTPPF